MLPFGEGGLCLLLLYVITSFVYSRVQKLSLDKLSLTFHGGLTEDCQMTDWLQMSHFFLEFGHTSQSNEFFHAHDKREASAWEVKIFAVFSPPKAGTRLRTYIYLLESIDF